MERIHYKNITELNRTYSPRTRIRHALKLGKGSRQVIANRLKRSLSGWFRLASSALDQGWVDAGRDQIYRLSRSAEPGSVMVFKPGRRASVAITPGDHLKTWGGHDSGPSNWSARARDRWGAGR